MQVDGKPTERYLPFQGYLNRKEKSNATAEL
jgi:hypothetical protein